MKLISFELCPFAKKVEILLKYKVLDCEYCYIDLAEPPAWFVELSPLSKVPLLVDKRGVIFESSIICEYLEDSHPQGLRPTDIFMLAENRSWIELGSILLWDMFYLTIKETEHEFDNVCAGLHSKLRAIEKRLSSNSFFNGSKVQLIDLSFIPFFQYLDMVMDIYPSLLEHSDFPNLFGWKQTLLNLDVTTQVYSDSIKEKQVVSILKRQGYFSHFIKPQDSNDKIQKSIY